MYSIGQRLREERLAKGIKLSEVSEVTRIRTAFLEAIEADRFDQLPGSFYARSFIRQYAGYLGLEDPHLEAEIKRQLGESGPVVSTQELLSGLSVSGPEKPPVLWRTQPASRRLVYATAALLAAGGLVGFYLGWRQVRAGAEPEWQAVPTAQELAVQTQTGEPGPAAPESAPAPVEAAPMREAGRPETPVMPAPPEAAEPEALTVEIAADRESWLEVRADGRVVFSDTLHAGQSRTFRAAERVRVLTGNAGGLRILRNGVALGPIGPEGQIRTIELTREGHTVLPPRPKPAPAQPEPAPGQPQASTGPLGGEGLAPLPLGQ